MYNRYSMCASSSARWGKEDLGSGKDLFSPRSALNASREKKQAYWGGVVCSFPLFYQEMENKTKEGIFSKRNFFKIFMFDS